MTPEAVPVPRYVVYLRVSTKSQGASGLGLEAQRSAVDTFVSSTGGKILKEFIEIESGKRADRVELRSAVAFARRCKATLLVAKLDRLSRNVVFLATLMESGIDFTACDNPHANKFTVHILAAVAEFEREMISKRTTEALAEAKKRGVKLGSNRENHWKGREDRRLVGSKKGAMEAAKVHRDLAKQAYEDVLPLMIELREHGVSLNAIADRLNKEGIPSRRGSVWYAMTVRNVLQRNIQERGYVT